MAKMTMPLTTEANTATRRPRSSGLGMAAVGQSQAAINIYFINRSLDFIGYGYGYDGLMWLRDDLQQVVSCKDCACGIQVWLQTASRSLHTLENSVIFCNKIRESDFFLVLTFTDRQVVAPLWFALPDIAVDLLAAHQLVSLSAPEGQRAAD